MNKLIILLLLIFTYDNLLAQCTNKFEFNMEPFWTERTYVPPIRVLWEYKNTFISIHEEKEKVIEKRKREIINKSPEKLIENIDSKDTKERRNIIYQLGRINSDKQIPILEDLLLNDTSAYVRRECAISLKYLNSIKSKEYLIKALSDNDIYVVLEAALALAEFGKKVHSYKALVKVWYANIGAKTTCHTGLRNIANDKAIAFLKKATNDTILSVSLDATIVLAQLGYKDFAKNKLNKLSLNSNSLIRKAVLYAMLRYFDKESTIVLAKKLKNDNDIKVQEYAREILLKINN